MLQQAFAWCPAVQRLSCLVTSVIQEQLLVIIQLTLLTSSNNISTLYQRDSEMNNAEQETHCSVYFPPFTFSEALLALIYCYE